MNKIMSLIGCSLSTASLILSLIDVATWVGLLVSLTCGIYMIIMYCFAAVNYFTLQ